MINKLKLFLLIILLCGIGRAGTIVISDPLPIDFLPLDELFAPEKQVKYIIDGHIDVGPYSYDVFAEYHPLERNKIFQVCNKYLGWMAQLESQEIWERRVYMNQFIVKPYGGYDPAYLPIPEPTTITLLSLGGLSLLPLKR